MNSEKLGTGQGGATGRKGAGSVNVTRYFFTHFARLLHSAPLLQGGRENKAARCETEDGRAMPGPGEKTDPPPEQPRRVSRYTQVTSWAVGRIKSTGLTAVQFNDNVPFALSADDALKLSRALQTEAEIVAKQKPK